MWKRARRNAIAIDGELRSAVRMSQSRLSILAAFFVLGYFLVILRLLDLVVVQGEIQNYSFANDNVTKPQNVKALAVRRGDIYDRNGFLLATTLKTPSLFVDPSLVIDAAFLADELVRIIPDLDKAKILSVMR